NQPAPQSTPENPKTGEPCSFMTSPRPSTGNRDTSPTLARCKPQSESVTGPRDHLLPTIHLIAHFFKVFQNFFHFHHFSGDFSASVIRGLNPRP
ncbi:MAG: hypothetical protein N2039_05675, partial [Gemmataceae bacterium]|nr:hypothetical protein [Gemmataceae bacterium]